jgi:CheY-like chemotaxis protein
VADFESIEYGEHNSDTDFRTMEPMRFTSKPANLPTSDAGRIVQVHRNASNRDVLVVDDDPDIRSALVSALKEEGYQAMSASNGREALELLRILPTRPSVILMDLMMPVMNGWEFRVEQLRDPLLSKIPVVVVSARENVSQEALQVAASGYLKKPFLIQDLMQAIGKFCGTPI